MKRALDLVSGQLTSSCYLYSPSQCSVLDSLSTIKHSNFQIILAHHEFFSHILLNCVRKGSLYERSDRLLKADGSTNITITFKMDAKKNDGSEHEQKKRSLTSTSLCSRPHSSHSLLFSQSKIILFLRQNWLRLMWQTSLRIENSRNLAHLTVVHQCNAREY